ncbi:MAG: S8 family serine peptidase [Thermoanaerobaculaceae bacterium]
MGTMVGDDGGTNQIGMAPQAKWIGCRDMDGGVGTPASYADCFQFFMAPTDLTCQNPDTAKAPHVINNSWGCPPSEGCTDPNVLKTVVENTRAAGIVVVVSAGNSGSSCSTVSEPAAIYDASLTVGATTSTDSIASYSSRGPVTVDGSNRLKPDVSAPGSNIRSSVPGGGYEGGWSGTSMAGPHVAGEGGAPALGNARVEGAGGPRREPHHPVGARAHVQPDLRQRARESDPQQHLRLREDRRACRRQHGRPRNRGHGHPRPGGASDRHSPTACSRPTRGRRPRPASPSSSPCLPP